MEISRGNSAYIHPRDWLVGLQNHIMNSPRYSALHKTFPFQPEAFSNVESAIEFHLSVTWHCRFSYDNQLKDKIIAAIRDFQREHLNIPTFSRMSVALKDERVAELNEHGYTELPLISEKKICEIKEYLNEKALVPSYITDADERIPLTQARKTLNVGYYPVDCVLDCPHVINIASDPNTLAIIEQYLGAIPTLINSTIWWSFADRIKAKDAQLFHIDNEDYRFCKLFIYLTDVDLQSGPHVYMEKTHRIDFLKQQRENSHLDPEEFDNWYLKTLRKSDKDTFDFLEASPRYFVGQKGSQFLVDTSGIHKGELPVKSDRLVCQFTYGLLPKPLSKYSPKVVVLDKDCPIMPRAFTQLPYSYVNRIFLQRGPVKIN
ncbi:MAG: hypothetical protein CFH06_00295 [Alphaproteobacteria bacterium MarineAlpha3_Bin5]|nr:MAG: hypothetical protein CFH06_00295 [Alphaproteobacteria bacterium MarineAlpha3_Bin5]